LTDLTLLIPSDGDLVISPGAEDFEVFPSPSGDITVFLLTGLPGASASSAIGTVTALPANDPPTVVNSGTPQAVILDFGIPGGASGGAASEIDNDSSVDGVTVKDALEELAAEINAVVSAGLAYREVTVAGDITVGVSDQIIGVNKTVGQATNVLLGTAAARAGVPVTIKDIKGDAATNNITPVASGGELCDGRPLSDFAITTNFGTAKLYPRLGAWYSIP